MKEEGENVQKVIPRETIEASRKTSGEKSESGKLIERESESEKSEEKTDN